MLSNSEEVKLMNHATLPDRLCETPVCKLQPGSIYLLVEASTSRCHPPPLIDVQTCHCSPSLFSPTTLSDRYRRSYDSEFTAPLVLHHVWPALMEGSSVIVKGEAVTRRGALVPTLKYLEIFH